MDAAANKLKRDGESRFFRRSAEDRRGAGFGRMSLDAGNGPFGGRAENDRFGGERAGGKAHRRRRQVDGPQDATGMAWGVRARHRVRAATAEIGDGCDMRNCTVVSRDGERRGMGKAQREQRYDQRGPDKLSNHEADGPGAPLHKGICAACPTGLQWDRSTQSASLGRYAQRPPSGAESASPAKPMVAMASPTPTRRRGLWRSALRLVMPRVVPVTAGSVPIAKPSISSPPLVGPPVSSAVIRAA